MKKEMTIERVTEEGLQALRLFASTFNHDLAALNRPTFIAKVNEKPVAYFELVTEPIIWPAISPEITPRELMMFNRTVYDTLAQRHGTFGIVTQHENFTDKIMKTLGFHQTGKKLYRNVPPQHA